MRASDSESSGTVGKAARAAAGDAIVAPALPARLRDAAVALEPILRALEALPRDGVLKAELACDPGPLVAPITERGFRVHVERHARRSWSLEVQPEGGPSIIDLRDLEAPEPMERVLEACAKLAPGAALLARTPCYPRPLLAQLERRALLWAAHEEPDGSGFVHVRRPG